MCTLELFLRFTLLFLLSLSVVQFFTQREGFHPWNKYGSSVIKKISSNPTNTTRIEYEMWADQERQEGICIFKFPIQKCYSKRTISNSTNYV